MDLLEFAFNPFDFESNVSQTCMGMFVLWGDAENV